MRDTADSLKFEDKKICVASITLASIHSAHMHNYLLLIGTHLEVSDILTQIKHCSIQTDTSFIAK